MVQTVQSLILYSEYIALQSIEIRTFHQTPMFVPQQPALWKTRVFKSIVKDHFDLHSGSNDNIYCIVSIGDSDDEYVASQEAKQMVTTLNRLNCSNNIVRLHRIKLKEKPTINEMVNQIRSLMREADVFLTERGSTSVHFVPQNIGK